VGCLPKVSPTSGGFFLKHVAAFSSILFFIIHIWGRIKARCGEKQNKTLQNYYISISQTLGFPFLYCTKKISSISSYLVWPFFSSNFSYSIKKRPATPNSWTSDFEFKYQSNAFLQINSSPSKNHTLLLDLTLADSSFTLRSWVFIDTQWNYCIALECCSFWGFVFGLWSRQESE
jgi:hypothetical protein